MAPADHSEHAHRAGTADHPVTRHRSGDSRTARARRPGPLDVVIVVVMLLLGALSVVLVHGYPEEDLTGVLPRWADLVAVVLLITPVAWRRAAPLAVCAWVGVGFAVFRLLEVPEGSVSSLAVFLAIHAAGAYGQPARRRDRVRGAALLAGGAALGWSLVITTESVSFDSTLGVLLALGINLGFYIAAWALGDAARRQREDRAELARRAEEIAAGQELRAEQAVTDERVRIARELHDVVAHHVSVMGVQAAAARHVLHRDPEGADRALATVEGSGRDAIAELQRLVGVLRSEGSEGVEAPQPTLEQLPRLIASVEAAGVPTLLRTIGRPQALPSSVQLHAYRIVQEALTNVVRHAPGARATVVLSHLPDALGVEVVNTPATVAPPDRQGGGGRGLLGMRERASSLGGILDHGPVARGGHRVAAVLPLQASALQASALQASALQASALEPSVHEPSAIRPVRRT